MKKILLFIFVFCSFAYSQTSPVLKAYTVYSDSNKVFKTNYGTLDTAWYLSRERHKRPTTFDSIVTFFTNFSVPSGSSYDTTRLAYKSDSTIVSSGYGWAATQSGHTVTGSTDTSVIYPRKDTINIYNYINSVLSGKRVYFLYDTVASVSGYKEMRALASTKSIAVLNFPTITDGDTLLKFITPLGYPNITYIEQGLTELSINATHVETGKKDIMLYYTLFKRDLSGVETLILSSLHTAPISGVASMYMCQAQIPTTILLSTDRLVIKIIAHVYGTGGQPTINVSLEDATSSHFAIPAIANDQNLLVPYVGATKDVNIGTNNLYAKNLTDTTTAIRSFINANRDSITKDTKYHRQTIASVTGLQDSLTNKPNLNTANTFQKKQTVDSLSVNGVISNGGATSDGTATYYLKGLGGRFFVEKTFSPSGRLLRTLDSLGSLVASDLIRARLDGKPSGRFDDNTAFATGVGGAIGLGGTYRTLGDVFEFCRISAEKANATDGNYSYNLSFYTSSNGGSNPNTSAGMTLGYDNSLTVNGNLTSTAQIKTTNPAIGVRIERAIGNMSLELASTDGLIGWQMYAPTTKQIKWYWENGGAGDKMVLDTAGNLTVGGQSGPTATPNRINMALDYSNGTTRDKLKLYLYNSGTEQYGFGVGSASDVQYHTNGLHDFYRANVLQLSLGNLSASFSGSATIATTLNTTAGTIYAKSSGTAGASYQLNATTFGYDIANTRGWIQAGGSSSTATLQLNPVGGTVEIGGTVSMGTNAITSVGAITSSATIKTGGYTVATLPAGTIGMRAYVTDALAPTFLGVLVGGGAVVTPCFYDGTNWVAE